MFLGGGVDLLGDQIVASVVVLAYSFVVSFIIGKVIDATMGLRVTPDQEERRPRHHPARRDGVRELKGDT